MLRKLVSFVLAVSLLSPASLAQSAASTPPTSASTTQPAEATTPSAAKPAMQGARVFVTDSQSWEIGGHSGGGGGAFASESHGGARPQTAEIIKTFGQRCPDVITNNLPSKVDYIVLLDHEGGKGLLRHKDKIAVFTRVTGDSVVSKSTLSVGGSVQTACDSIRADWAKNSSSIRTAEEAETAPQEKPAAAVVQQVAESSVTKLSVASNPAGADISVDGGFVGNTPSTIDVAAGGHVITVSKSGYKNWERKLKASGGNVNLNVELEAEAK